MDLLLEEAQVTDLGIDIYELTTELFELAELGDLPFSLGYGGGMGKGFRHGLVLHLEGQTEIGAVGLAGRVGDSGSCACRSVRSWK